MNIRHYIRIVEAHALGERAFHGTPHIVNQFDTDYVGSGEGAQVFGWGLYFADRKEVAKYYRDALTVGNGGRLAKLSWPEWFTNNSTDVREHATRLFPDQVNAVMIVWNAAFQGGNLQAVIDHCKEYNLGIYDTTIEDVTEVATAMYRGPKGDGSLYTVEIPNDTEFLRWDDVYAKQSPQVKRVLKKLLRLGRDYNPRMTGGGFYQDLSNFCGSQKNASLKLLANGVHGIKYFDQGSRLSGKGSYNYVIFDGALVKIVDQD